MRTLLKGKNQKQLEMENNDVPWFSNSGNKGKLK